MVFTDNQDEKSINILEASSNSIKSYEVYSTVKTIIYFKTEPSTKKRVALEEPVVKEIYSRQLFQSGRHRVEIFDRPGGPLRKVTAGGLETDLLWLPKTFEAVINLPLPNVIENGADYRELYRNLVGTISMVQILRERKNLVVHREGDRNRFLVVETDPMPKEKDIHYSKWGFRVRADAALNMLPATLEIYEMIDGERFVTRRLTVTEHKQIAEGIYAPVKAVAELFDPNKTMGAFGTLANKQEITIDPNRSRWNIPIKDEALLIPLPAGAKVLDTIKNISYVIGKPDPGKNLDDLAAKAGHITPIYPARPAKPKNWTPWIIAGCVATAMVAGLSFFFFRRKRLLRAVS